MGTATSSFDRAQVRPVVVVDGRRHRRDEDLALAQIFEIGRIREHLGRAQLGRLDLQRAVLASFELGDARRLDIEPHRLEMLAELHRQRQADVAKPDDTQFAVAKGELRHGV
jgi:hypothetical protein